MAEPKEYTKLLPNAEQDDQVYANLGYGKLL